MQKNVVFWWDELLQVCGWYGTSFRVGKRSPVQGETVDGEKTITLGSNNIFYDTVDAYTQEFTITKDRLATLTESPKRKGFLVTDWYLDKECTKPFTSKVLTLENDNESTIKINPIAERPSDGKPTSLTADNCTVDGSKGNITFTYEQKIGAAPTVNSSLTGLILEIKMKPGEIDRRFKALHL